MTINLLLLLLPMYQMLYASRLSTTAYNTKLDTLALEAPTITVTLTGRSRIKNCIGYIFDSMLAGYF